MKLSATDSGLFSKSKFTKPEVCRSSNCLATLGFIPKKGKKEDIWGVCSHFLKNPQTWVMFWIGNIADIGMNKSSIFTQHLIKDQHL
jgi:hypothetical protein